MIDPDLKALLLDMVKRCQSTVAKNYDRMKSSTFFDTTLASTAAVPTPLPSTGAEPQRNFTSTDASVFQSAFEEPPLEDQSIFDPWVPTAINEQPPFEDQSLFDPWVPTATNESVITDPVRPDQQMSNQQTDPVHGTSLDGDECQCGESHESFDPFDGYCAHCGLPKPCDLSFEYIPDQP